MCFGMKGECTTANIEHYHDNVSFLFLVWVISVDYWNPQTTINNNGLMISMNLNVDTSEYFIPSLIVRTLTIQDLVFSPTSITWQAIAYLHNLLTSLCPPSDPILLSAVWQALCLLTSVNLLTMQWWRRLWMRSKRLTMTRLTPNKVSPFTMYTVHLTNSTKCNFSWMMRRVMITVNLILSPANVPSEASTTKKKLLRPCSKRRWLHNTMALSITLGLTATTWILHTHDVLKTTSIGNSIN